MLIALVTIATMCEVAGMEVRYVALECLNEFCIAIVYNMLNWLIEL